jgi:hypothetical protein
MATTHIIGGLDPDPEEEVSPEVDPSPTMATTHHTQTVWYTCGAGLNPDPVEEASPEIDPLPTMDTTHIIEGANQGRNSETTTSDHQARANPNQRGAKQSPAQQQVYCSYWQK